MSSRGWWIAWRGFRVRGWCESYPIEGDRVRWDCQLYEIKLVDSWSSRQEAADVLLYVDEGLSCRVRVGDVTKLSTEDATRVLRLFEDEIESAFVAEEHSERERLPW